MARVASIFLFYFLTLHFNNSVIGVLGANETFQLSRVDKINEREIDHSFKLNSRKTINGNINKCEVKHYGIGGAKDVVTEGSIHSQYPFQTDPGIQYCYLTIVNAQVDNFGKYEITTYSDKRIVTTDIINQYKLVQTTKDYKDVHFKDELFNMSLDALTILEICNRTENKGLCPNDTFVNNTKLTCRFWRKELYSKLRDYKNYHFASQKNGSCLVNSPAALHDWYIEAWYGFLVIEQSNNRVITEDYWNGGNKRGFQGLPFFLGLVFGILLFIFFIWAIKKVCNYCLKKIRINNGQ